MLRRLAASEELYRLLADNVSDMLVWVGDDRRIRWASPSIESALGWSPQEWVGRIGDTDFITQDTSEQYRQNLRLLAEGHTIVARDRIRAKDGSLHWVESHVSPFLDAQGRPDGVVNCFHLIDDQVAAEEALLASERHYRLLAENSYDIVLRVDRHGVIQWVSPAVTRTLGWRPDDWIGRSGTEFLLEDDAEPYRSNVARVSRGESVVARYRARARDGSIHWVDTYANPFRDADGQLDGLVASVHTIDEQVRAEQASDRRARFDPLTGLLNRSEMLERLQICTAAEQRAGEEMALLFCDVDQFKDINDLHGHQAGDDVLRTIAARIRHCVREQDHAARMGGDELLVLLRGVRGLPDAAAIAETIRLMVATPITIGSTCLRVTVSVGVTLLAPTDAIDTVISRADRGMYEAKQRGRNQVVSIACAPLPQASGS